jgi:pyrroloquinoline quinone (PQQ) biosynthesis protein C
MPTHTASASIIDEICRLALSAGKEIPWLVEPLTRGRGRGYLLQHILRNRLLSSVIRPAWMSRCPDPAVVRKTIGQIREELVYDDAISQGHSTLLRQMGRNIGLTDAEMDSVRPEPLVEVAFNVWENIARTRHWIAGWLTSSVDEFIFTEMRPASLFPDAWKRAFGLSDEQVFFFSYHARADEDHAGRRVWEPIARHLANEKDRSEVLDGMRVALTALKLYYQGVAELGDRLEGKR